LVILLFRGTEQQTACLPSIFTHQPTPHSKISVLLSDMRIDLIGLTGFEEKELPVHIPRCNLPPIESSSNASATIQSGCLDKTSYILRQILVIGIMVFVASRLSIEVLHSQFSF